MGGRGVEESVCDCKKRAQTSATMKINVPGGERASSLFERTRSP